MQDNIENNNIRKIFLKWAQNTDNYDQNPLCEAQRLWGFVFLLFHDKYMQLNNWFAPKIKKD